MLVGVGLRVGGVGDIGDRCFGTGAETGSIELRPCCVDAVLADKANGKSRAGSASRSSHLQIGCKSLKNSAKL